MSDAAAPTGAGAESVDGAASVPSEGSRLDAVLAIARSDLRQRARSPTYLAVALLVAYLAQSVTAGDVRLFVGGGYTGVPNAAWFGGFVSVVGTNLLVLGGFSLVRGPITRDRDEGLAQLVATAPVGSGTYLLGRWLGYFAVLVAVTAALAVATLAGFLLHGTGPLVLWGLLSPFALITLPTMALVAAVAVCFEACAPLARTLGTAVYVFGALLATSVTSLLPVPVFDFLGIVILRESMLADVPASVTGLQRLEFRIAPPEQATTFTYSGLDWGPVELASRLPVLAAAALFLCVAVLAFDRFRADAGLGGLSGWFPDLAGLPGGALGTDDGDASLSAGSDRATGSVDRLGNVDPETPRLFDPRVVLAELRLALRGHRRLWYGAVAVALVLQSAAPIGPVRGLLVPLALLIPLSTWSGAGVRERRHRTETLVFTAPRPAAQTVAVWTGGVAVGLLAVSAFAARLALAGDLATLAAVCVGVAAMPALALAAGTLLGSARVFDTLYLVVWYLGPLQAVGPLDFVGATSVDPARTVAYAALAVLCLAVAVTGRRR